MKVSSVKSPENFSPVTFSITLESKLEVELMKYLFGADVSVPTELIRINCIDKKHEEKLSNMMCTIFHEVIKHD